VSLVPFAESCRCVEFREFAVGEVPVVVVVVADGPEGRPPASEFPEERTSLPRPVLLTPPFEPADLAGAPLVSAPPAPDAAEGEAGAAAARKALLFELEPPLLLLLLLFERRVALRPLPRVAVAFHICRKLGTRVLVWVLFPLLLLLFGLKIVCVEDPVAVCPDECRGRL